jgi:hypothetical protein
MHAAALAYINAVLPADVGSVLEFGSRNINGSVRDLVPTVSRYVGVDITPGPGADIVADAGTVEVPGLFDVVVCAEVFEHAPDAQCLAMVRNARRHLVDGGTFIATMAGPGRPAHSAGDGGPLQPGEFYRNVTSQQLGRWLATAHFLIYNVDVYGPDVRCCAQRP